jgi:hypothetical protein
MAKGKNKAQPKLIATLYPQLAKPLSAIGDFIELKGSEWGGCPASEKDNWFKCTVRKFEAVHEFPGGNKLPGFQVQEMGQSGEGSLEPGIASGDVFWVSYPNPFLKHYYKAHPEKLPDGHCEKPVAAVTTDAAAAAADSTTADSPALGATIAVKSGLPELKQEAPVYAFFSLNSDELCGKPGPHHGKRQQTWICNIKGADGEPCGAKRTLTCEKPHRAPVNSNLTTHIREEAKKCPQHAAALDQINEASKNQVLLADGSYTNIFTFEEAFPHHVRYVMMVAKGEISAVTGKKPMFRNYIRGAHAPPHPHCSTS